MKVAVNRNTERKASLLRFHAATATTAVRL